MKYCYRAPFNLPNAVSADRGAEEVVHGGRGEDEPPAGREQAAAGQPPAGQVGRAEAEEGEEHRRGEGGQYVGRRRRRGREQEETEKVVGTHCLLCSSSAEVIGSLKLVNV